MSDSTLKLSMVCLLIFMFGAFLVDAWQAVETARLRCAPSAAPAGSAP